MNRATAERKLAALGFEIDWSTTDKLLGYWSGCIDAKGRGQLDGDCRGCVVSGDTLDEFLCRCIEEAEGYAKRGVSQCTDPECDLHEGIPIPETCQ